MPDGRLYFEELSLERVLDIYDKENSEGVVVSVGGQGPNNIALQLQQAGAKVRTPSRRGVHTLTHASTLSFPPSMMMPTSSLLAFASHDEPSG